MDSKCGMLQCSYLCVAGPAELSADPWVLHGHNEIVPEEPKTRRRSSILVRNSKKGSKQADALQPAGKVSSFSLMKRHTKVSHLRF